MELSKCSLHIKKHRKPLFKIVVASRKSQQIRENVQPSSPKTLITAWMVVHALS